ncbi:MAG: DUF3488 and transglutaminase-like domain-containing protein [Renibacterium salmoninarum]|nr:DUF3488 and transglutaminase-like domain-containing protein [Renibacterium salmoninarum]
MTAVLEQQLADPRRSGRVPKPKQRPGAAPWALGAAIFLAVCGTATGLAGVLRGGTWFLYIVFTVGTVLAAMAVARSLRTPSGWVPVIGSAVLVLQLTFVFLSDTALLAVIPTPASLDVLSELLRQASDTVVRDVAPVEAGPGVLFVVCLGLGLVALLIDALAIGLMMPAISGLGLLAIALIPAVLKAESLGVTGFVLGAVGYLMLLALSHWQNGGRPRRSVRALWRVGGIGAGALVLALFLGMVIPGFSTGTFPQGSRLGNFGQVAGLSPFLSLGRDLREPTGAGRINYATTAASPPYLRTLTIENFDGESWQPSDRSSEARLGTDFIQNDFAPTQTSSQSVTTRISPVQFSSEWLPVPYPPSEINGLVGRWTWDPKTLALKALDNGSLGQTYTVTSQSPLLTPEILETAITPPRPSLDPVFMSLPANVPSIIRETALEVTGRSPTYYDKAMALQQYLRGAEFSYSLQAPVSGGYDGSSMGALAKFLEVKSGYCVHFSAAMAVMAREAGIPSRIGVGFAPGTATGQTVELNGQQVTEYMVDGRAAHAWPELYFEGLGWVPFEPTPSRGQVPSYAQTPSSPADPQNPEVLPQPTPSAPAVPSPPAVPPAAGGQNTPGTGFNAWLLLFPLLGLAVLAGLALPALSRGSLRHRRLAGDPTPANAWAEFQDTAADYGLPASASETPRRFVDRLAGSGRLGSPGPDLSGLLAAYERTSYGQPGPAARLAPGSPETAQAAAAVGALRKHSPTKQRLRATLFPTSTLQRWLRAAAVPLHRSRAGLRRLGQRIARRRSGNPDR